MVIDAPLEVLLIPLKSLAPMILIAPALNDLLIEGSHKLADEIRCHQLIAESIDNPCLDFAATNACAIGTGSLPPSSGAGDVVLADRRGRPAANTANRFSGQEMARTTAGPEL